MPIGNLESDTGYFRAEDLSTKFHADSSASLGLFYVTCSFEPLKASFDSFYLRFSPPRYLLMEMTNVCAPMQVLRSDNRSSVMEDDSGLTTWPFL